MQVLWIVAKFCEKFSCEEYKYEIIHTIISVPKCSKPPTDGEFEGHTSDRSKKVAS